MARVLVVDDEGDIRFLARVEFEGAGHEVIEAPHGGAAVAEIGLATPDLVVTDIMMPVMDGRRLIVWLRARPETLGIPILALSRLPAAMIGADAVLPKPFGRHALRDAGRALLRGRF